LEKKSGQKLQKLEMQIRDQAVDCARLEVLRVKERRDISMEQRERDKQLRQMSIDRAELTQQQERTIAKSVRLVHEKRLLLGASTRMKKTMSATKSARVLEKKVRFLVFPV
jgi:hypothetical protein